MDGRRWNAPGVGGIFLVSLAMLLYEILLTRIFSVVTWYHFAFVAVSMAMFGLAAGAMVVHLAPGRFPRERTGRHLALSALLLALTMAGGLPLWTRIPFPVELTPEAVLAGAVVFALAAIPFVFGGIYVCLTLTRFPGWAGPLYAADLAGAAVACLLVVGLLKLTDGPTAVVAASAMAAAGAAAAARASGGRDLYRLSLGVAALLIVFATWHTVLVRRQAPVLRLATVKGRAESPPLYERWNTFSRIRVRDPGPSAPFGWGLSEAYRARRPVPQLILDIDGGASTVLTGYDGDQERVAFLRYDITSLVHQVRPGGRVLIIGAGGGRDILAALVSGQRAVTGVEINEEIVRTVTDRFGAFTGHLDRDPRVRLVADEARSWLARSPARFDVIQAALIDTSAATAAGAYAFTENAIYTVEAWSLFLDRLEPGGLLSVSWFHFAELPAEVYRLVSLAATILRRHGIDDPRAHLALLRSRASGRSVATLLVGRQPLAPALLDRIEAVATALRFEVILGPRVAPGPVYAALLAGEEVPGDAGRLTLGAPTDDRPFFFNMLRLRDALSSPIARHGPIGGNQRAVAILALLLAASLVLTILFMLPPLPALHRRGALREGGRQMLFFAAIGFGFMLVEISLMQRLSVFLGHPAYGLVVVLFVLLLSGGAGSALTRGVRDDTVRRSAACRLAALIGLLALLGALTPGLVRALAGAPTPARILAAVLVLAPAGLFMGMAFPLGLRLADIRLPQLTPWLWGVNGATSVAGSVVATATALAFGISAAYWLGAAAYGVAFAAAIATPSPSPPAAAMARSPGGPP